MGSRKFGSFLFITTLLATSLQMIGARFLRLIPASGPFGAIYALFVLFYGPFHTRIYSCIPHTLYDV